MIDLSTERPDQLTTPTLLLLTRLTSTRSGDDVQALAGICGSRVSARDSASRLLIRAMTRVRDRS